jgi:uncharacterized protein with HEPN domain
MNAHNPKGKQMELNITIKSEDTAKRLELIKYLSDKFKEKYPELNVNFVETTRDFSELKRRMEALKQEVQDELERMGEQARKIQEDIDNLNKE